MSSPRITSTFYLLSFALLLQAAFGANIAPLRLFCANDNFTANGAFFKNLNTLMGDLYQQTPHKGFGISSLGQNPSKVNGVAQCRADVSAKDCRTCIADAISTIRKYCPYTKNGIVFYDYCLLKYSNEEFFGKIDIETEFMMQNVYNVSNPVIFNKKSRELLTQLTGEASSSGNPKMSAAGESMVSRAVKIYGLAQCRRDLSNGDCKKCLDINIGYLPTCCDGKQGGRVITGSCMIQYEIYPFLNAPRIN